MLVIVAILEMVDSDLTMASLLLHHPTKITTVYVSFSTQITSGQRNHFKLVSMMMFLVMPNPETGVVGQIHILVESWNVLEMNVPLSLMSNNSMKMAKNQTSFTAYQEAVKVSQIFEVFVLLLSQQC